MMTRYSDVHRGVKQDIYNVIDYTLAEISKEFPGLTNKELNAVLAETLARNVVQAEIMDMASYIVRNPISLI